MNTSEQLMRELAASNPVRDTDVVVGTAGQRRSMARSWSDGGVDDTTTSAVPVRREVSTRRRGGLLTLAASVAVLMGGTAAVTSGVADPLVDWVAGEDAEATDHTEPEDRHESDPLSGADLSEISDAQAAEIEDQAATEEEYRASYERYRQCLSSRGFEVVEDPLQGPDGTFIGFGLTDAAVQSGADEECYEREWRYTDLLWQSRPEVQDHPSRTQWIRDCLQERGITPQETASELREQLRQEGLSDPDCL